MRIIFYLIVTISFFQCSNVREFEKVQCNSETISSNENLRHVFKPCRQYIYQAKYWDEEYNLISDELIWMMATGKDWEYQPERQDEIIIQYNFNEKKIEEIQKFNINKTLTHSWESSVTTGIIEDGNETLMHPFRQNQYGFTEVASFPYVSFPLEVGKAWNSKLNIHEDWGDWSGSTLENYYEVISIDSVELSIGILDGWHIRGNTYASFGNSQHDFWYNDQYGFIKMIVKNYQNQLLKFELVEVIEE